MVWVSGGGDFKVSFMFCMHADQLTSLMVIGWRFKKELTYMKPQSAKPVSQ